MLKVPGVLPLATLARAEKPEQLLEQVAERVMHLLPEQGRSELAGCAAVLAGLRFDRQFIKSVFREEIMQESVIYQDILQQGIQQGELKGELKGELRG